MALTTSYWIDEMIRYPEGTLIEIIGGAICFTDPATGKTATPITDDQLDDLEGTEAVIGSSLSQAIRQATYWAERCAKLSGALVEEVTA